jgi:hypothetical protein
MHIRWGMGVAWPQQSSLEATDAHAWPRVRGCVHITADVTLDGSRIHTSDTNTHRMTTASTHTSHTTPTTWPQPQLEITPAIPTRAWPRKHAYLRCLLTLAEATNAVDPRLHLPTRVPPPPPPPPPTTTTVVTTVLSCPQGQLPAVTAHRQQRTMTPSLPPQACKRDEERWSS